MNTRFSVALLHPRGGDIGLIAEIKLQSPSSGILGKREEMDKRIKAYEAGGADALSLVVARERFGGDVSMIEEAKKITHLPIFAKDFITSPKKMALFKAKGADAVLLIAKIVDCETLKELVQKTFELSIEPVVEVQNQKELKSTLETDTKIIAVNARDLTNFSVDIKKACDIIRTIPKDRIAIGFSGIRERKDIDLYQKAGAKAILVGTALMQAKHIGEFIHRLQGGS